MAIEPHPTRRNVIRQVAAVSALGAGALALSSLAEAAAPFAKVQGPGVYRYNLGAFELTALYDGIWYSPIGDGFVRNAGSRAVNRALTQAFLKPNVLPISITALLVNTGSKLVLIDTGSAGQITDTAGLMNANLAAAGIRPEDIDVIVISHFHPDHINGIKTKDGDKVFTRAEIMVPEPEWAFWMNEANLTRDRYGPQVLPQRRPHLQGHRQRGAALQARFGTCARHRLDPGLWPHAGPLRVCAAVAAAIHAGDERHGTKPVPVRTPPRLATDLRHGRPARGAGAPPHARPRRSRPHAGVRLSFPLPGLRSPYPRRDRI
ncbi:MAG: MBL fold metallo-hydrolase [Proteobacteria bacterium]|nr:MBL fold metallo-hydrolase [Pseudomonadota bacterium]